MQGVSDTCSIRPATADWRIPVFLAVLALALTAVGRRAGDRLDYDRDAILAGEVWRIVTAHVVHFQWPHLAMNLAGLCLVWLLFGRRLSSAQWMAVSTACMVGVGAAVLLFHPEVSSAAGLSALLHGMFAAGALAGILAGHRLEWIPLVLLTAKLVWEAAVGPLPGSEAVAGGPVFVEAHLYGAIFGTISILLLRGRSR